MTTTNHWLSDLETAVIESRKVDREINTVVRNALLRTHQEMYNEPIKVRPFHRYFKVWVGRTSFYNLLDGRGGVSVERAIGLLVSDCELRKAVGLKEHHLTETELCVVHKLTLRSLASASLLAWLPGTKNCDMSSPPLRVSGKTCKEGSSFALQQSVSMSEKETLGHGSRSIKGKHLS